MTDTVRQDWDIVFWEAEVLPHTLPLAGALARHPSVRSVTTVANSDLSSNRREQGWEVPPHPGVRQIVSPDQAGVAAIFDQAPPDTVHVMFGMRWFPAIVAALREAQRRKARFGIFQEPRVFEGAAGLARYAQSLLTEGGLRRHADFVLAVGRHGPDWFRQAGYRRERIYPFAYFIDEMTPAPLPAHAERVRIGYLGRLVRAKGIHLFLEAFARLPETFEGRIAGFGPMDKAVRDAVARFDGRLESVGVVPMPQVGTFLGDLDIVATPSVTKDDGWGVVVSESLMTGPIVVASDRVGASMCLDDAWRGEVVRWGSATALAEGILRAAAPDRLSPAARARRQEWARAHIASRNGAAYLLAILDCVYREGPRPRPFTVTSSS